MPRHDPREEGTPVRSGVWGVCAGMILMVGLLILVIRTPEAPPQAAAKPAPPTAPRVNARSTSPQRIDQQRWARSAPTTPVEDQVAEATESERLAEPEVAPFHSGGLRPEPVYSNLGPISNLPGGPVKGLVTLEGVPPPEIDLPQDPFCSRLPEPPRKTRHYVVGQDGELADVYIVVRGAPRPRGFQVLNPVQLALSNCLFEPYILAVQVQQRVEVVNKDATLHNFHPTPDSRLGNREMNKAMPAGSQIFLQWDHPEKFLRIKCDVHPWMFGYVNIADHPYFALSNREGAYEIPALPPGRYLLEAHHRKAGTLQKEVEVRPGKVQKVNFVFQVPEARTEAPPPQPENRGKQASLRAP